MYKILIVEDDTDINTLLDRILKKSGYETIQAFSGSEARLQLQLNSPDLILLDLMLPGISGEDLITWIRQSAGLDMPVIIISARNSLDSKVATLSAGADDYITKPFEPDEVLVRIQTALRRYHGSTVPPDTGSYVYEGLHLEPKARRVTLNNQELTLTSHEFDILALLIQEPDTVYSRERLYELVWKNGYYGEDNTVNVHISNIRKKLAAIVPEKEYIRTVWGIGFKLI